MWRWTDMEAWFAAYEHREIDIDHPAVFGAINEALEARRNLHVKPNLELAARMEALADRRYVRLCCFRSRCGATRPAS